MTPIEQKIESDFEKYFTAFLQEKDGRIVIGSPGTRVYELDKRYLKQFCRELILPLHKEIAELKDALDRATLLMTIHHSMSVQADAKHLRQKFKLDGEK